jgi:Na+/H+-dicarboxylate symporter
VAIVALIICWIPFLGGGIALIALILGIVAWVSAKKASRPAGLAIAATIISVLAIIVGIVVSVAFLVLVAKSADADEACQRSSSTQAEYDQCMQDEVGSWFGVDPNS